MAHRIPFQQFYDILSNKYSQQIDWYDLYQLQPLLNLFGMSYIITFILIINLLIKISLFLFYYKKYI